MLIERCTSGSVLPSVLWPYEQVQYRDCRECVAGGEPHSSRGSGDGEFLRLGRRLPHCNEDSIVGK